MLSRVRVYTRRYLLSVSGSALLAGALVLPCTVTTRAETLPHSCLWRVQSSNTTAYLLGSIHMLSADTYPLPQNIEDAFQASERMVLEMDLAVMTNSDAQAEMLIKGLLPRGQSLETMLSPGTLKLAEQCSAEVGMPMKLLTHYQPWMFVMTLTTTKLQQLGFSPEHGLDWHFYNRAGELGISVAGLETLDEQLALFEALGAGNRDAFVKQSLEDFSLIEKELGAIIAAWRTGDLVALEATLLRSFRRYPDVHRILIRDRNLKWMKTLDEVMRSGVTGMIIVGAGHLPGEDGLLALLQARGYTLEQL